MADKIKSNGQVIELQKRGSGKMRMNDIAIAVGGKPRRVNIPSGAVMFINDNQDLPKRLRNRSASMTSTGLGDIYGDVVWCEHDEI